ncbi:hypothetical protein [Fibrella forsythiae]|uniref:Uncharacterized protein n=1 Tax=Fibrella forsythiae TaxID=2817061 RepID=A0ABS3JGL3_9BACT|nr:hypothetical protein [Fibrella forsythiae]MBO0949151.1 hypothetical protein [Fibrella forsythiae]
MAPYDHGPKTANQSIVIQILAKGATNERTQRLSAMIEKAGAHVSMVEAPEQDEHFSILHTIVPFNFAAYYMAEKLGISDTFVVGGKVTEAD